MLQGAQGVARLLRFGPVPLKMGRFLKGVFVKVILESTTKIVTIDGMPARIWEGKTESGVPCFAMITRIGVDRKEDTSQFEAELKECKEPLMTKSFPMALFLD